MKRHIWASRCKSRQDKSKRGQCGATINVDKVYNHWRSEDRQDKCSDFFIVCHQIKYVNLVSLIKNNHLCILTISVIAIGTISLSFHSSSYCYNFKLHCLGFYLGQFCFFRIRPEERRRSTEPPDNTLHLLFITIMLFYHIKNDSVLRVDVNCFLTKKEKNKCCKN